MTTTTPAISDDRWKQFAEDGYFVLGDVLSPSQLKVLQHRIDAIMLGEADIDYDRMLMQLDSRSGRYEDAGKQSKGHKGPTLNYRKIQDLEFDPVFLEFIQHRAFREACAQVYGADTGIAAFRSMFMNKPAHQGTFLPWHQDRWNYIQPDPLLTIWTALDPATRENGCVQIIPGSHRRGLINPSHPSGFLTPDQAEEHCPSEDVVFLELEPGETAVLHNHVLHASDVNRSPQSRRAFSVCYMPASTRDSRENPEPFPIVFGEAALTPRVRAA